MRMETPLSRVRGLGPAGHGGAEWWSVRLNSIALLLLSVWLIASLLRLPDLSYSMLGEWLRDPLAAVPMLLRTMPSTMRAQTASRTSPTTGPSTERRCRFGVGRGPFRISWVLCVHCVTGSP